MIRKITAFLISLALLAGFTVPTFASADFGDILYHWGTPFIVEMKELGIVNGYEDGNFYPDSTITRAEFSVLLSRLIRIPAAYEPASKFYDVGSKDWFNRGVVFLADNDILKDEPEGFGLKPMFRPKDNITREDMAVILDRFGNGYILQWANAAGTDAAVYNDAGDIAPYALESVQKVIDNELMTGYGCVADGNFMWKPKKEVTRAEAAKVVAELYHKLNAISNYTTEIPDEIKDIVTAKTYVDSWNGSGEAIISVYHKATHEKNREMGFVFDIVRHKHDELDKITDMAEDIGGITLFAYDDKYYYSWEAPTDVQFDINDKTGEAEYKDIESKIQEIVDAFIKDNQLEQFRKID